MKTLSYSDIFCAIYKWLNFELITNSFVWNRFVSCKDPIQDRGSIKTSSGPCTFKLEFQYENSTNFEIWLGDSYTSNEHMIFFRDVYNYPYDILPVIDIKDEKFCIKNESVILDHYKQEGLFFISSLVNVLNAEVAKKNNRELAEQKEFQVTNEFLLDKFKQLYEIVNSSVQSVLPKDFLNQNSDKTYHQETYCLTNYCLWVRYEETTEEPGIHNYSGVGIKLFLENKKIIIFREHEVFPAITIRFFDNYDYPVTICFDRTLEYWEPFDEHFFEELYQSCNKLLK